jgi:hypothetical protein
MGPVACERAFSRFGDGWVRLEAIWTFGKATARGAQPYREMAMFGPGEGGVLSFWSFTNDGKRSEGRLADGSDVDARAVCFEASMSAGLARQIYWPGEDGAVLWAVEARNKSGWKRFTRHTYRRTA